MQGLEKRVAGYSSGILFSERSPGHRPGCQAGPRGAAWRAAVGLQCQAITLVAKQPVRGVTYRRLIRHSEWIWRKDWSDV